MQTKSFIEVLETEIRADLRRELEAEMKARLSPQDIAAERAAAHAAGRFEVWLASHVGPVTFKPAKTYPKQARALKTPPPPPASFAAQTSAELFAVELLNRHSPTKLSSTFTADELKSVWRKAALKTHPDRFAGADEITIIRATALFRELASAYQTLSALTDAAAKAA